MSTMNVFQNTGRLITEPHWMWSNDRNEEHGVLCCLYALCSMSYGQNGANLSTESISFNAYDGNKMNVQKQLLACLCIAVTYPKLLSIQEYNWSVVPVTASKQRGLSWPILVSVQIAYTIKLIHTLWLMLSAILPDIYNRCNYSKTTWKLRST